MEMIMGKIYKHKETGSKWRLIRVDARPEDEPKKWKLELEHVEEPNWLCNYPEFCAMFEEQDNKDAELPFGICKTFVPDYRTTSATKCRICGKEKWEH